jgi:hypothetical protein
MTRFDRALRRRFRTRFSRKRSKGEITDTSDQLADPGTPQEVTSVRAKSQRHRKSAADKWNQ